ncbi:MAG: RloB domain-containing protein [Firmicutes bacterium]|nr:RloB domain-containing protein [Bacillota bacterium]
MPPRRTFRRPLGERRYRKMFVIATEGAKTEPEYFSILQQIVGNVIVNIKCLTRDKKSAPRSVLDRMKRFLDDEGLRDEDEAWLVVDKDKWTHEQLAELYNWSQGRANYGLAVSNPLFELWLLFHFEEAKGISTAKKCSERLKRYLPDYKKGIKRQMITKDMILQAINRAKQRDDPPCSDWPKKTGTTVYRLVERILCS